MRCGEFDAKIDRFIDGVLATPEMEDAARHAEICAGCNRTVSEYQQVRRLLSTAITERVMAVDVSGLWKDIEGRLDLPATVTRPVWTTPFRQWLDTAASWVRPLLPDELAFGRTGAWATVAAGLALVIGFAVSQSSSVGQSPRGHRIANRAVTIDSMEIGDGHSVSTWTRPRTGTRVIWVADASDSGGFSVSNVNDFR